MTPSFLLLAKEASSFTLTKRSWTTSGFFILAAMAIAGYNIWLITESRKVRKGVAKVYTRNGQLRLLVLYEHAPRNVYDVACPVPTVTMGTEFTVCAYGTELWNVRTVGDSPQFATGDYPTLYAPIIMLVISLIIILWYFVGVKR